MACPLNDPKLEALLDRLHAESDAQVDETNAYFAKRAKENTLDNKDFYDDEMHHFLSDKLVALDRDKAEFCYQLCCSLRATRVVEAGTSFGVSTIYLAAAVRDNQVENGVVIGTEYERQSLLNLGKLVDEGEKYGIPVMAVTAVGRELDQRESRYLALCCRICAELGAKVVKTYWCNDGFDKVVTGCPVPVVMAGGPQADTEHEVLEFVHDGMQNGSIGINLGRNIWQSDYPVPMIRALRHIVHENGTVKEAQEIFDHVKAGEGRLVSVPA